MNSKRDTKKDLQNNLTKHSQMAFIKDTNLNYLLSKTEKICTALYMVSDLLDKADPIRFNIKDRSLQMLGAVVSLVGSNQIHKDVEVAGMMVLEVGSLFTLAYRTNMISDMNYQIISSEIDNVLDLLKEIKSANINSDSDLFSAGYFAVNPVRNGFNDQEQLFKDRMSRTEVFNGNESFIKDNIKGHKGQNINNVLYKRPNSHNFSQKTDLKPTGQIGTSSTFNRKKDNSERRLKIIDIIKTKKKVSVKDISSEIPTVSEKTLQRELLAMVSEGLIKKEGERRWSRYFL